MLRVILVAAATEVLAVAVLIVLVALSAPADEAAAQATAERLGLWVGPLAGAFFCLLGGWWVVRSAPERPAGHGAAVGAAAAAIDVTILAMSGVTFQVLFVFSNIGRIVAGAIGGWLGAGSRARP